ncbi:ThiF family adenylyltransferase [Oceanisphaera sp. IT1-181]|uniref:ThiF family adenylyltransferase n=1 Tax=Oceanisphaera sp. IT1-181 TaxID=3081199 RepID=UPI0029CA99D6|nr:ThiF family adenylyltransferase [Oceanisphaera sp. IT1-181]
MSIHNLLLRSGFRYVESRYITGLPITLPKECTVYTKTYKTQAGAFDIAVVGPGEDLSCLPETYVIKRPVHLIGLALPHISSFQRLCLVNQDTADWDPQYPPAVISLLDSLIQKALDNAVTVGYQRQAEFQTEFVNYWSGAVDAYIYADAGGLLGSKLSYRLLKAVTSADGRTDNEYVVFSDVTQRDNWFRLRGEDPALGSDGDVTIVRVNNTKIAPNKWPPQSLSEVFDWLKSADLPAHDSLAKGILTNLTKDRQMVLFDISNEGIIGFEVRFSSVTKKALKHHAIKRPNSGGSKHKQKQKQKLSSTLPMLRSKSATTAFFRFNVSSISNQELQRRNRPVSIDLENKKILIIGCGTVGGFASQLLIKAGAGRGNIGRLVFCDGDFLSPSNLSRHALPATYIGWNKAEALSDLIKRDCLDSPKIDVKPYRLEMNEGNICGYDIVIDATGHAPTGKMLSYLARASTQRPPFIIHGYNDAYGQASVVMIDNGLACYECAKRLVTLNETDRPIAPHRISCGSIFTPYDASVSMITAALIQEAALSTLQERLPWTYAQHSTGNAIHHKRRRLSKFGECRVCT